MGKLQELWTAYKLRQKRRRLLFRAVRKRRQLKLAIDRSDQISDNAILLFSTVRNEMLRLPYFLDYYRKLGVRHFLMVDNNSDDGTAEYLATQPDVSLWSTTYSYKLSRFGVDWLTWLQIKYGHGHWCLTVDADEILIYPFCDTRPLPELTNWLDSNAIPSFGAIMLDMYPKARLNKQVYQAGQDPFQILEWFDADNIRWKTQEKLQNLWIQGGVRSRMFFANRPDRAPTLNKIPLVKWNRRFAYVTSTHAMLPRRLNHVFDMQGGQRLTGALLHSKFLHIIADKSVEEKQRKEHFSNSELYDDYYDSLAANPSLWCEKSIKYTGWQQLIKLNLLSKGKWL